MKTLTITLLLTLFASCAHHQGGKHSCCEGKKQECQQGQCKKDKSCCKDKCGKCDGKSSCSDGRCDQKKDA